MNPQLIAALVIAVLGFAGGWVSNGWRHDSIELVAERAAAKSAQQFARREQAIAKSVEEKLAALTTVERVIDRGIIKELRTNETIYRNVCISDAGRVLVNTLATGGADPGEPAAEVPRGPAAPAR